MLFRFNSWYFLFTLLQSASQVGRSLVLAPGTLKFSMDQGSKFFSNLSLVEKVQTYLRWQLQLIFFMNFELCHLQKKFEKSLSFYFELCHHTFGLHNFELWQLSEHWFLPFGNLSLMSFFCFVIISHDLIDLKCCLIKFYFITFISTVSAKFIFILKLAKCVCNLLSFCVSDLCNIYTNILSNK